MKNGLNNFWRNKNYLYNIVFYILQEENVLWESNIMTKKEWVKVNIQLPTGLENIEVMNEKGLCSIFEDPLLCCL